MQGIRTKSLASSPLNPINHEKIGQCRQHTRICVTPAHQRGAIQLHLHKNKDVRPAVFWVPYYKLTMVAEDTSHLQLAHKPPTPHQNTRTLSYFFWIWWFSYLVCNTQQVHKQHYTWTNKLRLEHHRLLLIITCGGSATITF